MVSISRKEFLKIAGLSLGGAVLASEKVLAAPVDTEPADHVGMLYDATMCVGCNVCSNACRDWNGTEPELDPGGLYDAPTELSADTWTIIQLYGGEGEYSFMKRQCMHCVDPGCVSGCPVHALQKTDWGPVTYDPDRCIGCRYCQYACPFHVPRFEWDEVLPVIAKCTLCNDRLTHGDVPACAEICPTGALVWGKRGELLAKAKARQEAEPRRYVNTIYGEEDAGGTSVLYLSAVPFDKLGLPILEKTLVPEVSEATAQVVLPSVLIGGPLLLAWVRYVSNRKGWG